MLAPFWLALAGVAALGVTALHLITTRRPPPVPLPTARFVPDGDARTAARTARPSDVLLLVLRLLAVLALGAAFAGVEFGRRGATVRRVVVVDRSRAASPAVRDSGLAVWREGDALVFVDSVARVIGAGAGDSLRALATIGVRGELSAGIAAARRAAAQMASSADSLELVLVSSFAADEFDAATARFTVSWPGRVRVVRAASAAVPAQQVVVRSRANAADSALARAGSAVVIWPPLDASAVTRPAGVSTGDATLVASLARPSEPPAGHVVARWADAAPAATEATLGGGCLRTIAIGIPAAGDVTLQPAYRAITRTLLGPCGSRAAGAAAPDSMVRALARGGTAAPVARFRDRDSAPPLTPWLLGAALLLLFGELTARRLQPQGVA